MNRVRAANQALEALGPPATYLEIGLAYGTTFRSVRARTKIGVEPRLRSRRMRLAAHFAASQSHLPLRFREYIFEMTSDDFFIRHRQLARRFPIDVALIDGLHIADQAYRDIVNALDVINRPGLLIVHDCNPQSELAAAPTPGPDISIWNGEVWKAIVRLRSERTDLAINVLDCDHGLGLIWRGTPNATLNLTSAEIAAMTYADLDCDRDHLLALRGEEEADELIRAALGT